MDNDKTLEQQIEWFHELAALTHDQLLAQGAVASNHAALARFNAHCLPNQAANELTSPEAFAMYINRLRHNEREWNNALCSALIDAEELYALQGPTHAASKLRAFAKSCPWMPFQEVAENQVHAYLSQV